MRKVVACGAARPGPVEDELRRARAAAAEQQPLRRPSRASRRCAAAPGPAQDERRHTIRCRWRRPATRSTSCRTARGRRRPGRSSAAAARSVGAMVAPSAAIATKAPPARTLVNRVRHADVPAHQRGDGERLQGAAGSDDAGDQRCAFDGDVGDEAAEPDAGPQAAAAETAARRARCPRRPDGRGIARRDGDQQRELGRGEIRGGDAGLAVRRRLVGLQSPLKVGLQVGHRLQAHRDAHQPLGDARGGARLGARCGRAWWSPDA